MKSKSKFLLNFLIIIFSFIVLGSSVEADAAIKDRITYHKKILTEKPQSIKAQCGLAEAYISQYITTGSTDKIWLFRAKKVIKKAEKINDKSALPSISWSKYYEAIGDKKKAKHYAKMALSRDSEGVFTFPNGARHDGNLKNGKQIQINVKRKKSNLTMKKLAKGLKYQDLIIGKGTVARKKKTVTIHYVAWLKGGKKFSSSRDRNQPLKFKLGKGHMIHGLEMGIKNMRVGGKRKLIIPSNLAYGKSGVGTVVPPDSTLVFEIELLDVK